MNRSISDRFYKKQKSSIFGTTGDKRDFRVLRQVSEENQTSFRRYERETQRRKKVRKPDIKYFGGLLCFRISAVCWKSRLK